MQSTDIIDNKVVVPTFEDGTKLTAEQKLVHLDNAYLGLTKAEKL